MWRGLSILLICITGCGGGNRPLAIGSPAPDFSLPGIDGKTHSLAEYAAKPCARGRVHLQSLSGVAAATRARLRKLDEDYRAKGVTLIAINSDRPTRFRLSELAYSDVGDSLADMKARVAYRRIEYPYLYDGDTQSVAAKFRVETLPHIFVFDRDRTLRYQGRIDDNVNESLVKSRDARDAIDAMLAGRRVPVERTAVAGCTLLPASKTASRQEELAKIQAEPVALQMAGEEALKKLRGNPTGKLLLVNFWATWCGPCVTEVPGAGDHLSDVPNRGFDFVSVSANDPEEKPQVIEFLKKNHASGLNYQFATPDTFGLQAAFDPAMPAAVPFTLLIAPNGDVLFQQLGELDFLKLRTGDPGEPARRSGAASVLVSIRELITSSRGRGSLFASSPVRAVFAIAKVRRAANWKLELATASRSVHEHSDFAAIDSVCGVGDWSHGVQGVGHAQRQAPARGRGIQPNLEHPILPSDRPRRISRCPASTARLTSSATTRAPGFSPSCSSATTARCRSCTRAGSRSCIATTSTKGVAFVAINPNNPKSIRLNELGYTDVTDSLEEMKIRTAFRHIEWPYLYDGETQGVSIKFGVVATPHIYLFDRDGSSNTRDGSTTTSAKIWSRREDARNALEAMLAGKPVPVTETNAFGCTTKWMSKATGVEEEWAKIQAEPVTLDPISAEDLKKLRANQGGKVLLVNFWSTNCAPCASQFLDLETTYRMYRLRAFDFVTVATDPPDQAPAAPRVSQEAVRVEPEQAVCISGGRRAAGGVGGAMEGGHAVHRGDRHRRQGAVSEGRKDRHPRGPPNDPRQHAGHEVLHRPAGLLATGGGGEAEEITPGSVMRDPRSELIAGSW